MAAVGIAPILCESTSSLYSSKLQLLSGYKEDPTAAKQAITALSEGVKSQTLAAEYLQSKQSFKCKYWILINGQLKLDRRVAPV